MSSDPAAPGSRPGLLTRLQPENWSVPVKLGAVVLVPIMLALTLGGLRIADQIHNATSLASLDRYVNGQAKVADLTWQLQAERDQLARLLAQKPSGDPGVAQDAFRAVDTAEADVNAAFHDPDSLGPASAAAYQRVQLSLDGLGRLRNQATSAIIDGQANPGPGTDVDTVVTNVTTGYTTIISQLVTLQASLDRQLDAPAMVPLANGLTGVSAAQEQLALEHTIVAAGIVKGTLRQPDADTVRAATARQAAATEQFRAGLDADQQRQYGSFVNGPAITQFGQLTGSALGHVGNKGALGVSLSDYDDAFHAANGQLVDSAKGLTTGIQTGSKQQQARSRNQAGIDSVILLLAVLTAASVVYLVGRSLLRPLRVLRSTALEVAGHRLPSALRLIREGKITEATVEPVPVDSIEEIGQVARAFDEVHGQAVRLAAEQAGLQASVSNMFINLSRRSQTLVERQLQLIERLERNEQDSDQLANLFQLDHLATRMRRNSENLLVLAGSELGKRGGAQVPVVETLRAAISEIEQYQRVVLQPPPPVNILGRAANDLVHLVAELLDNATSYSPPDSQVVVSSTRTTDGSLLIEIADQGVGMPAEELAAFNNRLSGRSAMDVSASRRMGLFVVGRLAGRHRIGVRLASSDHTRGASGGVTVAVNVPSNLITTQAVDRADRGAPAERTGLRIRPGVAGAVGAAVPGAIRGAGKGAANGAPVGRAGQPNVAARGNTGELPTRTPGLAPGQGERQRQGPARPGQPVRGSGPVRVAEPSPDTARLPVPPGRGPAARPSAPDQGPAARPSAPDQGPAARPSAPDQAAPERSGAPSVASNGVAAPAVNAAPVGNPAPPRADGIEPPAPVRGAPRPDDSGGRGAQEPSGPQIARRQGERPGPARGPAPRRPSRGSAELWEPNTPSGAADPQSDRPARGRERGESPIFEETSAWFRDTWQPATNGAPSGTGGRSMTAAPQSMPARQPQADAGKESFEELAAASDARRRSQNPVRPGAQQPVPPVAGRLQPPGMPAEEARDRSTMMDSDTIARPPVQSGAWTDQDRSLLQPLPDSEPESADLTPAGLPRRRPMAQLIPGSPGNSADTGSASPGGPPAARNADQVRGRLASYQSGVRQGRENRMRRMAEAASTRGSSSADDTEKEIS